MPEMLKAAVLAVAVVLSLLVCLIGVLVLVALAFLGVLVLANLWDIVAELATKRGRRRTRLLLRLWLRRKP